MPRDRSTDSGTLPGEAEPSTVNASVASGQLVPARATPPTPAEAPHLTTDEPDLIRALRARVGSNGFALSVRQVAALVEHIDALDEECETLRMSAAVATAATLTDPLAAYRDARGRLLCPSCFGYEDGVHSCMDMAAIHAENAVDAARYRWLRDRYHCADFDYDSSQPRISVLTFRIADDATVGANLDATIDVARAAGGTP